MKGFKKYGILFAALMAAVLFCGSAFAEVSAEFRENGLATYKMKDGTENSESNFCYKDAYIKAGVKLEETKAGLYIKVDPALMDVFFDPETEGELKELACLRAAGSRDRGIAVGIEFKTLAKSADIAELTIDGGDPISFDLSENEEPVYNNNLIQYFMVTDKDGKCLEPKAYDIEIKWYSDEDKDHSAPVDTWKKTVIRNAEQKPEAYDVSANADLRSIGHAKYYKGEKLVESMDFDYRAAYGEAGIELEKADSGLYLNIDEALMGEFFASSDDKLPYLRAAGSADNGIAVGIEFESPVEADNGVVELCIDGESKIKSKLAEWANMGVPSGNFIAYFMVTDKDGKCLEPRSHDIELKWYVSDEAEEPVAEGSAKITINAPAPTSGDDTAPTSDDETAPTSKDDDSGGCNAGFAGMLLLLALPLIAKRKD